MRSGIAAVDAWERGMTESLYANGMIGGDDLSRELDSIRSHSTAMRAKLTGSDLEIEEEELGGDAPYPVTAEANPDGP